MSQPVALNPLHAIEKQYLHTIPDYCKNTACYINSVHMHRTVNQCTNLGAISKYVSQKRQLLSTKVSHLSWYIQSGYTAASSLGDEYIETARYMSPVPKSWFSFVSKSRASVKTAKLTPVNPVSNPLYYLLTNGPATSPPIPIEKRMSLIKEVFRDSTLMKYY